MALAETVSANNATAVVYLMVFEIYRRGFAVLCAKAAFNALVLVNTYLEPREANQFIYTYPQILMYLLFPFASG